MPEIKLVSECEILQEKVGEDWYLLRYEEIDAIVKSYIKENDAAYYARPKESFFLDDARREARDKGKLICVCEDLS